MDAARWCSALMMLLLLTGGNGGSTGPDPPGEAAAPGEGRAGARAVEVDKHHWVDCWPLDAAAGLRTRNLTLTPEGARLADDPSSFLQRNEFDISESTSLEMAAAAGPDGAASVAWTEKQTKYLEWKIYLSRFDINGSPLGERIQVAGDESVDGLFPAVAVNARGDSVVVFEDDINYYIGRDAELYCHVIDAAGRHLSAIRVSDGLAGRQLDPDVATFSDCGFIVAWEDGHPWDGADIHARRFSRDCIPAGSEFAVCTTPGNQSHASIAVGPGDGFVIAWEDRWTGDADIRAQRFDGKGRRLGEEIIVSTEVGEQCRPAVAMRPDGSFLVCWNDSVYGFDRICARLFDPNGEAVGGELVLASSARNDRDQALGSDGSGNFLLAWTDDGGGGPRVRFRRFDANLTPLGNDTAAGFLQAPSLRPAASMRGDGSAVLVWTYREREMAGGVLGRGYIGEGWAEFPERRPERLNKWESLEMDVNYTCRGIETVRGLVSLDGGMNWSVVPDNGTLALSGDSGLRLRVLLQASPPRSTPTARSVTVRYCVNSPPVLASLLPEGKPVSPKRQQFNLTAVVSDPDGDPLTFEWRQLRGPPALMTCGTSPEAQCIVEKAGTCGFNLTVSDGYCIREFGPVTVVVKNQPPSADIELLGVPYKGGWCPVRASLSDPDGDLVTTSWTLASAPPGAQLSRTNPREVLVRSPSAGPCTLRLGMSDEEGLEAEVSFDFSFLSHPPSASLLLDRSSVHAGGSVLFDGRASSDPDGDALSFRFDFGDGGLRDWGPDALADHVYLAEGTWSASFQARDADGALSGVETAAIRVLPPNLPPSASFEFSDGNLTSPHVFTSTSRDGDGWVLSWDWYFGDGTRAQGRTVEHLFPGAGDHEVELSVRDDDGASSTCRRVVNINRPPRLGDPTPGPNARVALGKECTLSVNASDPDGDRVYLFWYIDEELVKADEGPALAFTPNRTGTVVVRVEADDHRGGTAVHAWSVSVVGGPAPRGAAPPPIGLVAAVLVGALLASAAVLFARRRKGGPGRRLTSSRARPGRPWRRDWPG